jgi:outer membrane protein OmpA-like peptidoglycan-associated protein
MAKAKPCRCKQAECEECPEWIFTFADLVMLMMGFFVILWVLKPSPAPKTAAAEQANEDMIKLAASIREAFGYVPKAGSGDPVDVHMLLNKSSQPRVPDGPGAGGKTQLKPEGAVGRDPEVMSIRPGQQSIVGGKLLFDRTESQLLPETQRLLDQIAMKIRGHRTIVVVKGHTALDDFDDTTKPDQKLDLSLRRAQRVADYLVSQGVEPEILRVVGCSTFEPIIQRDYTPTSQSQNRRVEVESTTTPVVMMQGMTPTTSPATQLPPENN